MFVKVIGCHGGVAPGYQTTCYQVDNRFLIDCGSACSSLTPKQQADITDIFITHPHLDHIKDICFVLENTFSPHRHILNLRSTPEILDDVHRHLLNNVIWPDFSAIPANPNQKGIVEFHPFKNTHELENHKITLFHVNHPGNAVGFLIDNGAHQVIFSGDTGPTAKLWEVANSCNNLKAIFTEISFPSNMDALAKASGHFTLTQLKDDMKKLESTNIPIYISHFKPLFLYDLIDEFREQAPDNFILMHEDDEIEI